MDKLQNESIQKLSSIGYKLGILTVDDIAGLTAPQLIVKIANKLNELVTSQNDLIYKVDEWVMTQTLVGLQEILDRMVEDGTIADVINQQVFTQLNNDINKLNNDVNKLKQLRGLSEVHMICMDFINNSNIIRTKDNQVIMIDCGGEEESGANSHIALENHMARLGINKIDVMIFTHAHTDHMGNAPYFIEKYRPSKIITKIVDWDKLPSVEVGYGTKQCFLNMKAQADALSIPIIEAKDEPILILNEDEKLTFLNRTWVDVTNYNGTSLLVMYENRSKKVLFSGDFNGANYQQITENVMCDIERLGHHGNSDSMHEEWIKKTRPRIAVADNLNIPNVLTVSDAYRFYECKVLTASENYGCVSFGIGGNQIISFNRDSSLEKSPWINFNGKNSYVHPSGRVAQSEFVPYKALMTSYIKADYTCAINESIHIGGDEYFANVNGIIIKNQWIQSGEYWFYYDQYGMMYKNTVARIEGQNYTFNSNGVCTNPPSNL